MAEPAVRDRREKRLAGLLLLVPPLVFAALYLRALPYDFVWMDTREIEQETLIRSGAELPRAFVEPYHRPQVVDATQPFYRPIQVVAVSLVHDAAGKRPAAYRLVGFTLGALTSALFTLFVWLWSGSWRAALFAGLLPAVHPAGIEGYVWIAALSEALVGWFTVLTVVCSFQAFRSESGLRGWLWGGASLLALLGSLGSKENGSIAPLLVAALWLSLAAQAGPSPAAAWARVRGRAVRDFGLLALQFALAFVVMVLWRPAVLGGYRGGISFVEGSPLTHLLTAVANWPRAIAWLAAPVRSSTSDTVPIVTDLAHPLVWLGFAVALASLAGWIQALRGGRGVTALGLAWVWIAYLPAANLVPNLHPWAERYVFLSVFGLALLLVDAVPRALTRVARVRTGVAVGVLAVLYLGALAQRTAARLPDWRNGLVLFEQDVQRDPFFREGRYEWARELARAGRAREAQQVLRPALEPSRAMRRTTGFWREEAGYALECSLRLMEGAALAAIEQLQELAVRRPGVAGKRELRFCLARAQEMAGRPAAALETYRSLVESSTEEPEPPVRLGMARTLAHLGRSDEARMWLEGLAGEAIRSPELDAQRRQVRRLLWEKPPSGPQAR